MHTLIDVDDDASQTSTTDLNDFVAEEFDDSSVVFTSAQLRKATKGFQSAISSPRGFGAVYRGKIEGGIEA